MADPRGFLTTERQLPERRPIDVRILDWQEVYQDFDARSLEKQAGRCMDCGIPFCHQGCPLGNLIPEWNDLIYDRDWGQAIERLHATNNFPEFTGRVCPAPCEEACTLNIDDSPVTIKTIECTIVDTGWKNGWIEPQIPEIKTGKKIAVVGSGPAGMACAQQLARVGHEVTLFEKFAKAGGLLRYGIPDFKMEKHLIDRRAEQMAAEGVIFRMNTHIGKDVASEKLLEEFDAVILTGGSEKGRDLPVPGRKLDGIEFAMDFLPQQNRRVGKEPLGLVKPILAEGKNVVVIGGGDTGSDCIGTSFRQGAVSVTQLEIMPAPPEAPNKGTTWPFWPLKYRTSSSQAEGAERDFSVATKEFIGSEGRVEKLRIVRLDKDMKEIPGSEFELDADLVLLAMGFVHPIHEGMLSEMGVDLDERGNVKANTQDYQTAVPKIFAAGDMRRGQSLVVWAIREGRQCARAVDKFLMGETALPR